MVLPYMFRFPRRIWLSVISVITGPSVLLSARSNDRDELKVDISISENRIK